ncbi:MAG: hypothetical protein ACE5HT_13870 [Gemmatimonadales bacterium]
MTGQMGLTEFFAMEAGEYLERLDGLLSASSEPDSGEFVRLTRALRGSALMANQRAIGAVAEAFENLARAFQDRKIEWNEATKQEAIRGVDDLKVLVRSIGNWSEAENARAAKLAADLGAAAGGAPTGRSATPDTGLDSGTRAFVAREGAAVASALRELAQAIQRGIIDTSQLDRVLRSMQPLRGLAVLSDLPPIPELLAGVDRSVSTVLQQPEQPNDTALMFDVAARALSRAAQEVAASGAPDPDSAEGREFAQRLRSLVDIGGDVVAIESLYYDDDGPHVVEEGIQSVAPGRLSALELVAHGEHLQQAADELERAQWDTQRELRALALSGTFRSLVSAAGAQLAAAMTAFTEAASDAVHRGVPVHQTAGFVTQLRKVGVALSTAAEGEELRLEQQLSEATASLKALPSAPARSTAEQAAMAAADGPLSRPTAPSAAVQRPTEAAPPQSAPVAGEDESANLLAASWSDYEAITESCGPGEASLEELLAGPSATWPRDTTSVAPSSGAAVEEGILPITELCYTGTAAAERAQQVKSEIREVLAVDTIDRPALNDLVEELLDLVELIGQ